MVASKSDLATWLQFISALFWPATVLVALAMFRGQLRSLLTRMSSFKLGDTELAFQTPSVDGGKKTTPVKESNVVHTEFSTFLTETGVRDVIRESGLLETADEIYRTTRIFSTSKQNTWIAFSKKKLFCILDDEKTRKSGRLIQWTLASDMTNPVRAHVYKQAVGLLDIGPRTNWLYSTSLFSSPEILEREITAAIAEGA
jgi:hypothetical protein